MASVSDLVDLPKQISAWEAGDGFRKSYGIDAERALVKDLRTLLALCVQQSVALEAAQERIARLEEHSPSKVLDDLSDELEDDSEGSDDSPLEESAQADRRARRQAKLAREALQEHVIEAYGRGVSINAISDVTGLGRQTVYRMLGLWKRRPRKAGTPGKTDEPAVTLI